MVSRYQAHDLLWGMTAEQLPMGAPSWAVASISAGQPVVVRRALSAPGQVAVGIRGALREQRFAAVMEVSTVTRCVRPEELCHVQGQRDFPALRALTQLRSCLDASGWIWGVSGSAGFELASGFTALHEGSDLDLILRTPEPLGRSDAQALVALLDNSVCRVDLQLQTPLGAVALREWAGASFRVLLKNATQACLVSDPWNSQEQAA
ncbi:malonate decarboxylase holo-ACP synthase [Pseudomonas vancouverensis]|uniref:Malonate decarboxylase holo-ACP synthase n=1 Tax=Pseudomonas vancouverensis TaxID=95300 RepID=A0A1H2PFK8_PSEVA|nr:malonate decarboxylase holo-ACP synthase [Pseudomonas vancouverensis]KAB0497565.1 malonate decarboxylase holo-ACP synthase [Pseudomonas vancouverensis]TDB66292.1 malonate decarboxylase holo-ACP synthase [Pseudomonas vancouverensis]SDV16442.1 phosphoribosyl-dephospho-CoA transferase [Pseudomonas vancouverensis]